MSHQKRRHLVIRGHRMRQSVRKFVVIIFHQFISQNLPCDKISCLAGTHEKEEVSSEKEGSTKKSARIY